jgi:glutamyl-tRNA synthetase
MLGFLVVPAERFRVDEAAVASLDEQAGAALRAASDVLEALDTWTAAAIEDALRAALVDGLGLKPKVAFTPVRVAVTGRRVSPPLFESMALLGREVSLGRVAALAGRLATTARGGGEGTASTGP